MASFPEAVDVAVWQICTYQEEQRIKTEEWLDYEDHYQRNQKAGEGMDPLQEDRIYHTVQGLQSYSQSGHSAN